MTDFQDPKAHLFALVQTALSQVAPDLTEVSFVVERSKQAAHGDYACNVAMQLTRVLRRNPRELAQAVVAALPESSFIVKTEIAGAGFINFFLTPAAQHQVVRQVQEMGERFGRCEYGARKKVQVEFVSANPTGPLHVGHGRGAAYGASLAAVLDFAGYKVQREYYVNDAGRQMDILAVSTWLRYLSLFGIDVPFPKNSYQGDYVREMAKQVKEAHGDRYVHQPWTVLEGVPCADEDAEGHLDGLIANAKKLLEDDWHYIHNFALNEQLGDGRNDLAEFGVHFDNWYSEKSLFDSGLVERAIDQLEANGHLYMQDGAKWFRSTNFGDEKDRVVQRENGLYTYFASDIAYHQNKFERGFHKVINVWGADHHGYISRVKGALVALNFDPEKLDIALVQFANLIRDGKQVSMSTRSGEFVTLRELRGEVGNDAARFFYVLRKSEQHLDFDLDLAKSQSNDNPVYYIQYAHARICRVLEEWNGATSDFANAKLDLLGNEHEATILRRLSDFSETVENAAREYAPHQVAFYLKDLAADFHSYYNAERFLIDDAELSLARLALIDAVRQTMVNGLRLLGVKAPEKM